MKAKREILLKPLQMIVGVVERRQTLPILGNVLVRVIGREVTLAATDLEVELRTRVEVESTRDEEFTLPARKFLDICKALPEGADVSLEVEGDKAVLRAGRGRYSLGILPAQDFPGVEEKAAVERFEIAEDVLKGLIERTQFAMAQQDVRYYLNGLLLEVRSGRVRAVATDGHRLAVSEVADEELLGKDVQVIVPRKAVLELGRLLEKGGAKVGVEVSASHVKVVLGETTFISKLIDGRFPDYERVMPRGDAEVLVADREILRQALIRTAILSNEKYRGIRFRLEKGSAELVAHNPEQEEAEERIEVEYDGKEMTVGFNVTYLLDVINVLDAEKVELSLVDANSSCLIRGEGREGSRYVVMPMRL
ncbi:MAG: DNA polymerase III subunit beta [Gammaproteobacteria bacterium]|jgi:DNA polymerase-3 subunit beta|nr:DNA polymerase III subunit beta [Gammaproteobacteria bacterium]